MGEKARRRRRRAGAGKSAAQARLDLPPAPLQVKRAARPSPLPGRQVGTTPRGYVGGGVLRPAPVCARGDGGRRCDPADRDDSTRDDATSSKPDSGLSIGPDGMAAPLSPPTTTARGAPERKAYRETCRDVVVVVRSC